MRVVSVCHCVTQSPSVPIIMISWSDVGLVNNTSLESPAESCQTDIIGAADRKRLSRAEPRLVKYDPTSRRAQRRRKYTKCSPFNLFLSLFSAQIYHQHFQNVSVLRTETPTEETDQRRKSSELEIKPRTGENRKTEG